MNIRNIIGLILILLVFAPVVKSQDAEAEKIKGIIKSFVKDLESLPEKGSEMTSKLMSYTNSNFRYDVKVINIMNLVDHETMDYKTIEFALNNIRTRDVKRTMVIGENLEVFVRRNLAYARYPVHYEVFESDRMINKGNQNVDLILRQNPQGEWKIEWMNVLSADELTYKSTCICEIYETKGLKNIITETIVPDGHEVDILEDKFSIDESIEPRAVRHGFRDYLWAKNGAIYKRNFDGSQGDQVGNAPSRPELLLTLLKNEAYPDRCNTVIRKLK